MTEPAKARVPSQELDRRDLPEALARVEQERDERVKLETHAFAVRKAEEYLRRAEAAEAHAQRVEQALRELATKWRKDSENIRSHIGPLHQIGWTEALRYCADHLEATLTAGGSGGARSRSPALPPQPTEK